jgi:hypothetical protein
MTSPKMALEMKKKQIGSTMRDADLLVGEQQRKTGWLNKFHLRDVVALDVEKV